MPDHANQFTTMRPADRRHRSAHPGPQGSVRCAAPLLLLAAWLGGCAADDGRSPSSPPPPPPPPSSPPPDFTPRGPSELSASKWVSCEELLGRLQPHAPSHQLDATKLKRLVPEWYQDHPSYAGLAFGDWCKRLKENDPQGHLTRVFKFPFEFTPAV